MLPSGLGQAFRGPWVCPTAVGQQTAPVVSLQSHLHGLTGSFALTAKFPCLLACTNFLILLLLWGFAISVCQNSSAWDQAEARHGMKGGVQHKNRDWTEQPFQLKSPWSCRPALAPPVRQCEYHTKQPSLRCKPSRLEYVLLCCKHSSV